MTPIFLPAIVVLCVVVVLVRRTVDSYKRKQEDQVIADRHGCLPPPMLENQRPFGVDRLEQIFRANTESRLMELFLFHFRQWGPTLQQCFLRTTAFGTIEPANLEAMLSSNFHDWDFGPRRKIAFPMFGDGIFTQEGSAWKHSRELLRPQFHFKQYDDLGVFRQSVDDLVEIMAQSGSVVDVQPLFFRLTLDTTTAFLFGESVRSLQSPSGAGEETFAEAFNTAQKYVAKRFRLLDLYWLIGGRDFDRACRNLRRFADQVIDRNLNRTDDKAGDEKKYVFLEALARESPDRNALRDQIINILAAGRDTTACLLSWTFFLLVRHPKVIEKLRTEINTASTDPAELNRQSLKDLGYLQNVLKETLRLYPSLPVNTRTSTRTTVLPTGGGPDLKSPVLIPKGSAVAYSTYAMHRRPDLYGMDAEIFRPERWDEEMPMNHDPVKHRWGYLPFHGGPRICLGMDFALTEAAYTVVRIFQTFPNIELPDGEPVELTGVEKQTITLTISSAKGCKIRLSKQQ